MENTIKCIQSIWMFFGVFSDLNVQEDKVDVWLRRRLCESENCHEICDKINSGRTLSEILKNREKEVLMSAFNGLAAIAQTYGEFYFSTGSECDLGVAQYANHHNAMAVITNDTDFLIFDGPWRLWNSEFIILRHLPELKIIEFDRKGIEKVCSLSRHQLPLFATLLGNDYTSLYCDELYKFVSKLRPWKGNRFQTIAHYVRKVGSDYLSDLDIRRLVQHVFGHADNKIQQLIRRSLDSYNTDRPPVSVIDPIAERLVNTSIYESYMENIAPIQPIMLPPFMPFDDEREKTFPMLLLDWVKRKRGILQYHIRDKSPTFTALVSTQADDDTSACIETPSYPDCELKLSVLVGF